VKLSLPVEHLFPGGYRMVIPDEMCVQYHPIDSYFVDAECFVQFRLGIMKGRDVELTAWHEQIFAPAWMECVQPIYRDGAWSAETRS